MGSSVNIEAAPKGIRSRRAWVTPMLEPHSTMTVVTQAPVPAPLNLLFLQASISQCFDANHNVVPCPGN
jgi:hypothetical protein